MGTEAWAWASAGESGGAAAAAQYQGTARGPRESGALVPGSPCLVVLSKAAGRAREGRSGAWVRLERLVWCPPALGASAGSRAAAGG